LPITGAHARPVTLWCLLVVLLVRPALGDTDLRVAVCVVGQVSRTEVQSKIENLIKPNLGNVHIDVFLILQPGKARFTNQPHPDCKVAPASLEEAHAAFSEHTRTFLFENHFVDWDVPDVKFNNYPERGQRRKNRLTNHLNQYLSWKRCAKVVAKQEIEDGDEVRYDAVMRVRDNALVLRPFAFRERLNALVRNRYRKMGVEPPSTITNQHIRDMPVVLKRCSSWGGLADKTMLAPRNYMEEALSGPADLFHLMRKGGNRTEVGEVRVSNPETYLKYVFRKLEVPLFNEWRPELFPVTDGRCEDGESFCMVVRRKDCRPPNSPVRECADTYFKKNVRR